MQMKPWSSCDAHHPKGGTLGMRHTRGGRKGEDEGRGGKISDVRSALIFDLGIKENGKWF